MDEDQAGNIKTGEVASLEEQEAEFQRQLEEERQKLGEERDG